MQYKTCIFIIYIHWFGEREACLDMYNYTHISFVFTASPTLKSQKRGHLGCCQGKAKPEVEANDGTIGRAVSGHKDMTTRSSIHRNSDQLTPGCLLDIRDTVILCTNIGIRINPFKQEVMNYFLDIPLGCTLLGLYCISL